MFSQLIQKLGAWPAEEHADRTLREIARATGLSDEALVSLLRSGAADGLHDAEAAYSRLWTLRMCKLLVLACQRYWAWGATDLFRLRISSAIGYLRLEAECVGLVRLFVSDDSIAERWSRIQSKDEGKAFFRETQGALMSELKTVGLDGAYSIASTTSQHVRMGALARSFSSDNDGLALPDQDFDPDDPFSYHLSVAHYHRIQVRVLAALGHSLPAVADNRWDVELTQCAASSDSMWAALENRYKGQLEPAAHVGDEQGQAK